MRAPSRRGRRGPILDACASDPSEQAIPRPCDSGPQAAGAITRLSIACPDQPGIVAATSRLLTDAGANIVRKAESDGRLLR